MSVRLAVALAAVLMLAGCSGGGVVNDGGGTPETVTTTTATQSTSTPSETRTTTTATTTVVETPQNPWGEEQLVVSTNASLDNGQEIGGLVDDAVTYWNQHNNYAQHDVELVYRADEERPDIEVRLVKEIEDCGGHEADRGFLGCAPLVTATSRPDDSVLVEIAAGYTANSTRQTIKHELGHVLGVSHADEPQPLMAAEGAAVPLVEPSVSERDNPWYWQTTRVYIDTSNASSREGERLVEGTKTALGYFEEGAEGVAPENLTFEYVNDSENADVIVRVVDEPACRDDPGSCDILWGTSTDARDDVFNYNIKQVIELYELDPESYAWHVGVNFNLVFEPASQEEFAPPFRDASYDERRSEWWD